MYTTPHTHHSIHNDNISRRRSPRSVNFLATCTIAYDCVNAHVQFLHCYVISIENTMLHVVTFTRIWCVNCDAQTNASWRNPSAVSLPGRKLVGAREGVGWHAPVKLVHSKCSHQTSSKNTKLQRQYGERKEGMGRTKESRSQWT